MIMATCFVALPLVIREVVPVLTEIGDDQEQAARSLGANARQTFLRITLPSIKWAVVYGVVLTLARSLGEFGAVKIVSGNITGRTQTATLVVEAKYQNFAPGDGVRDLLHADLRQHREPGRRRDPPPPALRVKGSP